MTFIPTLTALLISALSLPALAEQSQKQEQIDAEQVKLEAQQQAAKGTGLDPTEVVARIEFNYTYLEQTTGTERHSGILKLDTDLTKTTVVGVEVPLASAKLDNGSDQNGIGDVGFKIRSLVYASKSFSTMVGGGVTFDTASDDELGEGDHKASIGMFNAWRHGEWLVASISSLRFYKEKDELNSLSISPLIAYQPMGEYFSYISVGLPFSYRYDAEEEVMNAFLAIGKVMPNKDVYSFGTKINISGPDIDDFVLTIGYKRLF